MDDPWKRKILSHTEKCSNANKRAKNEDVRSENQQDAAVGVADDMKVEEFMEDKSEKKKKIAGSAETPLVISDSENGVEKNRRSRNCGQRIAYSAGAPSWLPSSILGAILMKHGGTSSRGGGANGSGSDAIVKHGGGSFVGGGASGSGSNASGFEGRESAEAPTKREEENRREDVKGKAVRVETEVDDEADYSEESDSDEEEESSSEEEDDDDDDDYEEEEEKEEEKQEKEEKYNEKEQEEREKEEKEQEEEKNEEEEEEDRSSKNEDKNHGDNLDALWAEMDTAMDHSKDMKEEEPATEKASTGFKVDYEHSFVLKEEVGYVCCYCGLIGKHIESLIDVKVRKSRKNLLVCGASRSSSKDIGIRIPEDGFSETGIFAHPRHTMHMKARHVDGFNFLCRNLAVENPGGCVLARAPVFEKMFLMISFIQGFLAKCSNGRALLVIPKRMLGSWMKEFQTWQVEDIPLLDLYSVKAVKRVQPLVILRKWAEEKSILFLGHKQFSRIVSDSCCSKAAEDCKKALLSIPTIAVLDRGPNLRNEIKKVLPSFAKIQTPRKVILSWTIYQCNLIEVFNALVLVRPMFLRPDESKAILKRIMTQWGEQAPRTTLAFFDFLERALQDEEDFTRKAYVVRCLQDLACKFVHYYSQKYLNELPGLEDFTVVLKPSPMQKNEIKNTKIICRKGIKVTSFVRGVSVHPVLSSFSKGSVSDPKDDEIDAIIDKMNLKDGVKAKFFMNMIDFCESANEKLLVFSQFITPLNFLQRLAVKAKGWLPGKQTFMLTSHSGHRYRQLTANRFNSLPEAKVLFGSTGACGEEISLVNASRIIILEGSVYPTAARQAIEMACRPGQEKKVYVYRLVVAGSVEERDHWNNFKREVTGKMWFDSNEYFRKMDIQTVGVEESGDFFLGRPSLKGDIKALFKR